MLDKLRPLLNKPLHRYIIIGGSVYILEVIVIVIAQGMGAQPLAAVSISFWIGLIISFTLQKFVTFRDKRMHHRVILPQIIAVSGLVLFNFGFTLLVTKLFRNILPTVGSRTIALIITTIWNYYLYKTKIFKTQGLTV